MTENQIAEEQPTEAKKLQEVVVYHIVNGGFEAENIYAMGGSRPNAKHIAHQYGCELEVRWSKHRQPAGSMQFFPSYLERHGIVNGECKSAVLVGEDREKLHQAREDILRTFGYSHFDGGSINVGRDKIILS